LQFAISNVTILHLCEEQEYTAEDKDGIYRRLAEELVIFADKQKIQPIFHNKGCRKRYGICAAYYS